VTLGRLIAVAVVILQAFTPFAYAGGVGSAPDSLEFSLTRDGRETRTLVLLAESVAGSALAVTVTGPAREWVTVTPFGSSVPLPTVEIGEDGRALVEVTVTIPFDAGNGTYVAAVEISTIAPAAKIQTAIAVPITIGVTGDAAIAGSLERVVVPRAVPVGADIVVNATVTNTGTVAARPSMAITISNQQDVRSRTTTEFAALRPGESVDLSARVEAVGVAGEELTMDLVVLLDSSEIGHETDVIDLTTAGSAASVAPLDITVTDPAEPGGVTRLVVSFVNDGLEPVAVTFIGSASRNGVPVTAVESIQVRADPGEIGTAEIFVTIERDGDYQIVGRWEGDGITSEPVSIEWGVGSAFPMFTLIAVFAVLTLILIGATIRYWRQSEHDTDSAPSIAVGGSLR